MLLMKCSMGQRTWTIVVKYPDVGIFPVCESREGSWFLNCSESSLRHADRKGNAAFYASCITASLSSVGNCVAVQEFVVQTEAPRRCHGDLVLVTRIRAVYVKCETTRI